MILRHFPELEDIIDTENVFARVWKYSENTPTDTTEFLDTISTEAGKVCGGVCRAVNCAAENEDELYGSVLYAGKQYGSMLFAGKLYVFFGVLPGA